MIARARRLGLVMVALFLVTPSEGEAQLLSPGKLSKAHEELEGIRLCTSCHQLGKRGISAERCLSCHEPVATRIAAGSGYHAFVPGDACADCHQDHLGEDIDLVRLDEEAFDHAETGYRLELSHDGLDCRTCHEPSHITDLAVVTFKGEREALERTFLGLPAECGGCHLAESPHGDEFGPRRCTDCHDTGEWTSPRPFDHTETAFPLRGLHAQVQCTECHGSGPDDVKGRLSASETCSGCHSSSHGNAMSGECADCHDPRGWHVLVAGALDGSFDHSRTAFALRGAHSTADCTTCHRPGRPPTSELVRIAYRPGTAGNTYPRPVADGCSSCHVDRHAFPNEARRWLRCASCHSEAEWTPSAFGLTRHAETSSFPLSGAHTAAPCVACHQDPAAGHTTFLLALGPRGCVDCHETDDRHRVAYAEIACESCHSTSEFDVVAYDHSWQLGAEPSCSGCHDSDDLHAGQFDRRECSSCHVTDRFTIDAFDHATTLFPLDGAHDGAACSSCHLPKGPTDPAFVRYRPLGTECTDCHGGDR